VEKSLGQVQDAIRRAKENGGPWMDEWGLGCGRGMGPL